MNRKSVAKAILEAVDDKDREKDEPEDKGPDGIVPAPVDDIDKVVKDEPTDDPEFAPDANMVIKDQDEPESDAGADVEKLADVAHGSWSGWMEYLFGKSQDNEDGSVTIPAEEVERWRRQMATSYEELTDEEKESDRVEARKYIVVMTGGEVPEEPAGSPAEVPVEVPEEPVTREPYHSMDVHDGPGEDDGW